MPRNKPLSFAIPIKDKAFLYQTLKVFSSLSVKNHDLRKLALKFTPGKSPVYLQDWQRQVIVHWLLKLHNLSSARDQKELSARFKGLIEILK